MERRGGVVVVIQFHTPAVLVINRHGVRYWENLMVDARSFGRKSRGIPLKITAYAGPFDLPSVILEHPTCNLLDRLQLISLGVVDFGPNYNGTLVWLDHHPGCTGTIRKNDLGTGPRNMADLLTPVTPMSPEWALLGPVARFPAAGAGSVGDPIAPSRAADINRRCKRRVARHRGRHSHRGEFSSSATPKQGLERPRLEVPSRVISCPHSGRKHLNEQIEDQGKANACLARLAKTHVAVSGEFCLQYILGLSYRLTGWDTTPVELHGLELVLAYPQVLGNHINDVFKRPDRCGVKQRQAAGLRDSWRRPQNAQKGGGSGTHHCTL
jgi:hypothetical protein